MREKKSPLVALVIASIFLFSPAYIDYQELIEVDFFSSGESYEDRDIDDFSLDEQQNFTIGSTFLPIFSLPGNNLSGSPTDLSSQIPCTAQEPITLRC